MKLCGLEIDFPDIDGVSDRQIWYAEKLRQEYVISHEDRFREIAEIVQLECDYRMTHDEHEEITETFFEEFNKKEKACLLWESAGSIISVLKESKYA